jgi:hypothetical protein
MSNLQEIIKELRAAKQGSHQLDSIVYQWWWSVTPPPAPHVIWTTDNEYAPSYTTSFNDAFTLLPKNALWDITFGYGNFIRVRVSNGKDPYLSHSYAINPDYNIIEELADSTPILALVTACLRHGELHDS